MFQIYFSLFKLNCVATCYLSMKDKLYSEKIVVLSLIIYFFFARQFVFTLLLNPSLLITCLVLQSLVLYKSNSSMLVFS